MTDSPNAHDFTASKHFEIRMVNVLLPKWHVELLSFSIRSIRFHHEIATFSFSTILNQLTEPIKFQTPFELSKHNDNIKTIKSGILFRDIRCCIKHSIYPNVHIVTIQAAQIRRQTRKGKNEKKTERMMSDDRQRLISSVLFFSS